MSRIDVNISASRITNDKLLPLQRTLGNIAGGLLRLQTIIDPRLLAQNNLQSRIGDAHNTASSIETELGNLHTGIAAMLNLYKETDQRLSSGIQRSFRGLWGNN